MNAKSPKPPKKTPGVFNFPWRWKVLRKELFGFKVLFIGVSLQLSLCNAASILSSDISGSSGLPDGIVNMYDVAELADQWLNSGLSLSRMSGLNVKEYGALGDGITDDTSALKQAISDGHALKLPVLFPTGNYKVTEPLEISLQSLVGIEAGGWNSDVLSMPKFLIRHDSGPAITMKDGSSIHGIAFDYTNQASTNATILLSGIGLSISNVRIQYCYDGIIADGTSNIGRLNIENVFMVQPRGTGVYVTGTWDISCLRNIEIWNNNSTMMLPPKVCSGGDAEFWIFL